MILIWLLLILVILFYIKFYFKWRDGPPGPFPLPIIGNILQLVLGPPEPNLAIANMSKKYGDTYRIQLGIKDFVIASSIDSITRLYNRDETLGRDLSGTMKDRSVGQNTGIIFAEGDIWDHNRRWTFKTLKKLGLNKSLGLEAGINSECNKLLESWQKSLIEDNRIIDINPAFIIHLTNIVFKLVIGERIFDSKNGEMLQKLLVKSEEMSKSMSVGAGVDTAFPFLRHIFPKFTGKTIQMDCYSSIRFAAKNFLNEVIRDLKSTNNNNDETISPTLTHAYAQKIISNGSTELFSEFHFGSIFMDVFQASSDTTNAYLQSLVLFAVIYEKCQNKIYKEIERTIPANEDAKLNHRKMMHYTEAFMMETHRHSKIVPNLLPRQVTKEFKIDQYVIPKGVCILADLCTAYDDPRIWNDPSLFLPERFLNKDGHMCEAKRRMCLPFSIGKRSCPGDYVAEASAFIFLVNIIRNFTLSIVSGQKPPTAKMMVGITCGPYPFKIEISKRK